MTESDRNESVFSDSVKELVAIGSAIGSNCELCFKYHFNEARKLGVSKEDIWRAVDMACKVKQTPANTIRGIAEKLCSRKEALPVCGCTNTKKTDNCC